MADFYHITIETKEGITYDQIEKKMNLALDWYKYHPKCWIVYTTSDAEKWFARLEPLVKPGGTLFICRLDTSDNQGWVRQKFWDWLNKDREPAQED